MKKLLLLVLVLCCTSCAALPAEERAFAVALLVERNGTSWQVYGRIPAYKAGGEYLTVTGEGPSIVAALADMDASAPMKVTLSQLRLLVLRGAAEELSAVLAAFAEELDVRVQCALAVTEEPAHQVMEVLKPDTGARLSKSLDVLLEARREQGIPVTTLADAARMGTRQSPVLTRLALDDGKLSLNGAWAGEALTPEESTLLAMLMGTGREVRLTLPEGDVRVRDVHAKACLEGTAAKVTLTMTLVDSALLPQDVERSLADACVHLLSRLSAAGWDALGLGRQAILGMQDMPQWQNMTWPDTYRQIQWEVAVRVNEMAR